jgi:hypothetical protein
LANSAAWLPAPRGRGGSGAGLLGTLLVVDRGCRRGQLLGVAEAGEHDLLVRVLVVDAEQAVLARAVDREVAQVVVVVAELEPLLLGGLRHRVELGSARQHRVAPADQDLGLVAGRDVVLLVDARRDLAEPEARRGRARRARRGREGERPHRGADRGHRERVLQQVAAVVAGGDHVAHGRAGARVVADVLGLLAGPLVRHALDVHPSIPSRSESRDAPPAPALVPDAGASMLT